MIEMSEFDEDGAHAWALSCAQEQGCTCEDEPVVSLENCDEHGVHLYHFHGDECEISLRYRKHDLIANAHLN